MLLRFVYFPFQTLSLFAEASRRSEYPTYMAKESPTSRTLEVLREQGYTVAIVEKWNPHARIRQDLFGFIDILAIKRDETLAVQATASGVSDRLKKIMASDLLPKVREAGWKIQIWGWRKSTKTNKYVLRILDIS